MKRLVQILATLLLLITMASCVNDATQDVVVEESPVERVVTARIEPMTRTSMEDCEVGETAQVVWSAGDVIGLVTSTGEIRQAKIKSAVSCKEVAEFTVTDAVAGDEYIYGFYPYNENVTYSNGKLDKVWLNPYRKFIPNSDTTKPTLPSGGTFPTNEFPMVAKAGENGDMYFKSICSIIELRLTNDADFDYKWYNITLQSDKCHISGSGSVDLTADSPKFVPSGLKYNDAGSDKTNNYSLGIAYMLGAANNGNGIQLNATTPTSLFYVMPIQNYTDLKIQATTTEFAVTKCSTASHNLAPNTILAFKTINLSGVDDIYGGSNVTDLSVDADGNAAYSYTYLVKPSATPKKYKFTARLSDGTRVLKLPDATTIHEATSNYNTTFVLTEDSDGVVTNLRREGETVYFTASKPGNAVIKLASTSFSPIAQFHIWVSDVQEQILPGGHVFMDRNLGATYAPQSLAEAQAMTTEQVWRAAGCHYQWGNPTPAPSLTAAHVGSSYSTPSSANCKWQQIDWLIHQWCGFYHQEWFTSGLATASLARAQQYANYHSSGSGASTDDHYGVWCSTEHNASKVLNVGTNALWQSDKTMFDPCPIGYRVPSKQEMLEAFTNDVTGYKGKSYTQCLPAVGQYYNYKDQFVFLSWSGVRTSYGGTLVNSWFTNKAHAGWWYFDESATEATIAAIGTIRYGHNGTDVTSTALGKNSYPYVGLECDGEPFTSGGAINSASFATGKASAVPTSQYRALMATRMGVRCIRESSSTSSSTTGPSYDVDDPSEF